MVSRGHVSLHDAVRQETVRDADPRLVGESITANLVLGLIAVFAGIWIATTEGGKESGKA
ncbi:MAG: hypothetical protein ABIL01_30075 [Pseudomonadota bacterium]